MWSLAAESGRLVLSADCCCCVNRPPSAQGRLPDPRRPPRLRLLTRTPPPPLRPTAPGDCLEQAVHAGNNLFLAVLIGHPAALHTASRAGRWAPWSVPEAGERVQEGAGILSSSLQRHGHRCEPAADAGPSPA